MTPFTATLVVIAFVATLGATYVWWPRSHAGDNAKRDTAVHH